MKYEVKTKIENGVLKIDARPSAEDKRKLVYLVMNKKGQTKEVDKKWLVENIDNIANLGLSGASLYLKGKNKVSDVAKVEDKKEVKPIIKKEPMKIFNIEVHNLFQSQLPLLLKKCGFYNVDIEVFGGGATYSTPHIRNYKLKASENPYPFKKGYLALKCRIEDRDNLKILSLSLVHEYDEVVHYLNGGSHKTTETAQTFVSDKFIIGNVKNMINPKEYGVRHNPYSGWNSKDLEEKYEGSLYSITLGSGVKFIDASEGDVLVKNAFRVYSKFIKDNKNILEKYLYALEGYKALEKIPYVVVESDRNGMYAMPHADKTVEKAFNLEKKGYKIILEDAESPTFENSFITMTAEKLKAKRDSDLKTHNTWGTANMKYYKNVSEYVDKKKKVFYIKFGKVETADMWC